jgi:hypothetical protein
MSTVILKLQISQKTKTFFLENNSGGPLKIHCEWMKNVRSILKIGHLVLFFPR